MSLATTYPTLINGVEYKPFKTWNVKYIDVVTIHETEAGTQEDVVINKGRRSISVGTTCLQPTATLLAGLDDLASFTVKFYDIKTNAYVETTMRVVPSSMSCNLREKTANLASTNGVYDVSFTMEEFG